MIRIFDDNKHICECCDNDSIILIDFTEDTKPSDLGSRVYLCKEHKEKLLDLLLPYCKHCDVEYDIVLYSEEMKFTITEK